MHAHNIRGSGSRIKSTNGKSNGLIPFLKIFNETAKSVDQGGGKRKGSFAVYFCLLYTSPSPRDRQKSRMPSSA